MFYQSVATSYINAFSADGFIFADTLKELNEVITKFNENKNQRMIMMSTPKLTQVEKRDFELINDIYIKKNGMLYKKKTQYCLSAKHILGYDRQRKTPTAVKAYRG